MISKTFTQPPTTQKDATLYQHALEVKRVVSQARSILEGLDNQDGVDLNTAPGTVVVDRPQAGTGLTAQLVGAYADHSVSSLRGQLHGGQMEAEFFRGGDVDQTASYQETEQEKIYTLHTRASEKYEFHPGTISVRENKQTGALSIEQQQNFPWELDMTYACTEKERVFPPTGPQSSEDAAFFRQGEALQKRVDGLVSTLKAMDNGDRDLNPEAGVVVVAGFSEKDSDNLVHSYMAGNYRIPTEAELHFNATTGEVQSFSHGFADHKVHEFQRGADGTKSYRQDAFLGCESLEVAPDGTRLQQKYGQTDFDFSSDFFKKEHQLTVRSGHRERRPLDGEDAVGWGAVGGAFGMGAAFALGLATAPVGLAVILGSALVGGLATQLVSTKGYDLEYGVTRCQGKTQEERFRHCQMAFENRAVPWGDDMEKLVDLKAGEEGVTRQQCIENLGDPSFHAGPLLILTRSLGADGEPALVMIPKTFEHPIRTAQDGIHLPGDVVIPYGSIRGITMFDR